MATTTDDIKNEIKKFDWNKPRYSAKQFTIYLIITTVIGGVISGLWEALKDKK